MAGPDALYVIAAAPPFLVVGGIFTVGMAIAQHRLATLVLVIVLPFVAALYVGLIYAARSFGPAFGLALGAVGVAIMTATMVNPVLRVPRRREAHA
jgi:hypothetical protein